MIDGLGPNSSPAWYAEARRMGNLAFAVQIFSSLQEIGWPNLPETGWHDWMTDNLMLSYPEVDPFVLATLVYLAYVRRPIPQIKVLRLLCTLAGKSLAAWVGDLNRWERGEEYKGGDFFPSFGEDLPADENAYRIYHMARASDAIQCLASTGFLYLPEKGVLEVVKFPLGCGEMQFISTTIWEIPELSLALG